MKSFTETSKVERKEQMHRIIDHSYCSLLVYYGDDNEIHTYATGEPGSDYDILSLFATAASRAAVMVDYNIDTADLLQEGGTR